MKILKILCLLPLLLGCSKGQGISLHPYTDKTASPARFTICHGFSCTYQTDVSMPDQDWNNITAIFSPPPNSAKEERKRIAKALALIETKVTTITKMTPDRGEAENFESDEDQMDCIDETINTSQYLRFLEKDVQFKWHKTSDPIHRGYFIDGMWPHNSATLREIKTDDIYALDTYFFDSGKTPPIVYRDLWLDEWKPETLKQ